MTETETVDLQDSDIEFPDMHQGLLDDDTVEQYFRDLEHAQVFQVLVKGAPQKYAGQERFELSQGRDLFSGGEIRGLQIRYLWDGTVWWDTLMCSPRGTRIVRVQHDPA